jgi:hypothetical protein
MNRLTSLALLLSAVALAPRTLHAQGRTGTVELGIDGGFEFSNVNELDREEGQDDVEFGDRTRVSLPLARFRVGYHVSDRIAIEPSVRVDYDKVEDPRDDHDEGDITQKEFFLALSTLIHFGTSPYKTVPYGIIRGSFNVSDFDVGDADIENDTVTQFGVGGGIGLKLPATDRLDVRLEGTYEYRFQHKSDLAPASNNYQFAAGFSWYTKSP